MLDNTIEFTKATLCKYHELSIDSAEFDKVLSNLVRQLTKLSPYEEQFTAAKKLSKGIIANQNTGEGKTLSILLAALYLLKNNKKVYIVTSNDYLSERDYEYEKPLFEALGYKAVHFGENTGGTEEEYKSANIIFATGQTLIFDYLRGIKADYDFALIDEVDYILVESAQHDFSVSDGKNKILLPEDMFKRCLKQANEMAGYTLSSDLKKEDILFDLNNEYDYLIDRVRRTISITPKGYEKTETFIKGDRYEYIETLIATLLVKHFYNNGEEYIVKDGKIEIINGSNGRVNENGSNDIYIQTAIEVKEGIKVTEKGYLYNTCAYPVFFSIFNDFSGISGTTAYVPYDFSILYGKDVAKIKDHFKTQRDTFYQYFQTDTERYEGIAKIINAGEGPFLIATSSDAKSKAINEYLQAKTDKTLLLLDNMHLGSESEFIQSAAYQNTVLISSRIVGRGTDIKVANEAKKGLTVILSERFPSKRTERQFIGRCGRNGKKGTAYIMTSKEDTIFDAQKKKRWPVGENDISHLQDLAEEQAFTTRKHIFIRSKFFFEQDKAIKERLTQFKTYDELAAFLKKVPSDDAKNALSALEEKSFKKDKAISKYHSSVINNYYKQIRPYFQAQFIRYNDLMPNPLHQDSILYQRTEEYVKDGRNLIAHILYLALG